MVVGGEGDLRAEPGMLAKPDQMAPAVLAAGDPWAVRVGGQVGWSGLAGRGLAGARLATAGLATAGLGSAGLAGARLAGRAAVPRPGHQVNLLVEDQPGPGALRGGGRADRGPVLCVLGDQRNVHLAGPEHPHRLRRLGLGQQQIDPGVPGGQPGQRGGDDRRQRGREDGQPDAFLPLLDVCGQLPLGGVQPAQDLLRPPGEQAARVGQPDAPPRTLGQPGTGLGLQARQVVAHRRLGVVERPGRGCHRSMLSHRDQDT